MLALGDGGGIDGLGTDHDDLTIRPLHQRGDFPVLLIGFSLVDFAIEADVGVEEGLGGDILKDVNLVRAIQTDVGSAVGDDAAEAVGAFDDAGFWVRDSDIELGAVRESVGEDIDLARAAAAGLAGRDADGFLEKRAPLGDFDIHRLGGEGSPDRFGVDGGADPVAPIFADRVERGEVHRAGEFFASLQE